MGGDDDGNGGVEEEDIIVERDDEGNTWVIDLGSCVVMRKAAGAGEELHVVGRWDPVAQAVVLLQEEANDDAAAAMAGVNISDEPTASTAMDSGGTGNANSGGGSATTKTTKTAVAEVAAALPPPPVSPPLAPPLTSSDLRQLCAKGYAVVDGALDKVTAGKTRQELQALMDDENGDGGGGGRGGGGGGGGVLHKMGGRSVESGRSDAVAWLRWKGVVSSGGGGDDGGVSAPPLARAAIELLAAAAAQLAAEGWSGEGYGDSKDRAAEGSAAAAAAPSTRGPLVPARKLLVPPAAQLAVYQGEGARYEKHLDNVRTPGGWWLNARAYTAILYLNDSWHPDHGGCLRLHVDNDGTGHRHVDVEPLAGRLVVFSSKDVPHEVLPMRLGDDAGTGDKEGGGGDGGDKPPARYAITLWILDPEIPLEG